MIEKTLAAIFHKPGQPFEHTTIPLPTPRGSEVLVEVIACTLCGSDLHSINGKRKVPVPTILGHEILGKIVAFGPDAARTDAAGNPLNLGDRVTWAIVASCDHCFYCQHDLPQKCERQTKYGHESIRPGYELTGGLAGHCLLAEGTAIFLLPENLADSVACPANCATATVAAAFDVSGSVKDQIVMIMGAGMLGITAVAWAKASGARSVIIADTNATRLKRAVDFGATETALPHELAAIVESVTAGYGVDFGFEFSGASESFETILRSLRIGGTAILIGSVFPVRPVEVLPEQIVKRCLNIKGMHNYAPKHLQAALRFLNDHGHLPFEALVSPWHRLSELDRLVDLPPSDQYLRIGIRPGCG